MQASQITVCPACGQKLKITKPKKRIRCPACKSLFDTADARDASERSLESAKSILEDGDSADLSSSSVSSPAARSKAEPTLQKLGRFDLKQLLGQGGFGRVYRAYDPQLERFVALKVPLFGPKQKTRIERFLSEAKASARLRHPNIVATFEAGKADKRYYMATEYVEGEPLSDIIKRDRPDVQTSVEIVTKLAEALAYAHNQGIVHRDIKPHNILIDEEGEPKLMDFGLAKRLDDDSNLTIDGALLGTPAYMSPEQARGESDKITAASDQYSLGVVLFHLLTGETPYQGSPHTVVAQVSKGEQHTVRSKSPSIDQYLDAVCQKAMSPAVEDRYETCEEFSRDLYAWKNNLPMLAHPRGKLWHLKRYLKSNYVQSSVVGIILITLVLMGIKMRSTNEELKPEADKYSGQPGTTSAGEIIVSGTIQKAPKESDSSNSSINLNSTAQSKDSDSPDILKSPCSSEEASATQTACARRFGVPVEFKCPNGITFRLIPHGNCRLGTPDSEKAMWRKRLGNRAFWVNHEFPAYDYKMDKPFFMGAYEITVGQFRKFVDETGYQTYAEINHTGIGPPGFKGDLLNWRTISQDGSDDLPVGMITTADVSAFVDWLNHKNTIKYIVPSEQAWEYACRAGTVSPWFCEEGELDEYAWYKEKGLKPVGLKKPNPFGLYDIYGNMYEDTQNGHEWYTRGITEANVVFLRSAVRTRASSPGENNGPYWKVGVRLAATLDSVQKYLSRNQDDTSTSSNAKRTSLLQFLPENLDDCLLSGSAVRTKTGELTLNMPDGIISFLEIPVILPKMYQLDLSVRQESTDGAFVISVPHRGYPVSIVFDGRSGSGISLIDGKDYGDNFTNMSDRQFKDHQTHTIRIVSSSDGLFVEWDGKRLFEFTGEPEQLSLDSWAQHPNRLFPTLRTDLDGHFVVERMTVQTKGQDAPKYTIDGRKQLTKREQEVAKWVRNVGGQFYVDDGFQIVLPPEAKISDDDFKRFQDLPNLSSLIVSNGQTNFRINGTHITDNGILQLKSLPRLNSIVVGGSGITNRGLQHLSQFPIKELTVYRASVTQDGLNHFKGHKLKRLALNYCRKVNDQDLDENILSHIEELILGGTSVTNGLLDKLKGNQKVRVLSLRETPIKPEVCKQLGDLNSIEALDVSSLGITDKELVFLSSLNNLKSLGISRNRLTAEGLQKISNSFSKLETLDASFNRIDSTTNVDWRGLQKLTALWIYGFPLRDQQLLAMAEMENLQTLGIDRLDYSKTKLSIEAMREFAKKLPECMIAGVKAKAHVEKILSTTSKEQNQSSGKSPVKPRPEAAVPSVVSSGATMRPTEKSSDGAAAPNFEDFLAKQKLPARDDIITALKEAQSRASSVEKGHVVIGQVELPVNCSLNDLVCQGVVLDDGYFVDAVQTPGIPIWFWHPRCSFGESIPKSNERDIEWLGKVKLKADKRRATVQGIARVNHFAVPENLDLKVDYAPGFINSISPEVNKLEMLMARMSEIAKPLVEVNQQTGVFKITGLLDAPVLFKLSGKGPERFSTVVNPSMESVLDMGICELYSKTISGPLPDLDDLVMAEDGSPKLKSLLEQIKKQSGKSPGAIRFVERISEALSDYVQRAEKFIETNGERSAVALIIPVVMPDADLSQLKSTLRITQAVYAPAGTDTRSTPRIIYDLVKPGTIVRIMLPGHLPFEYQVRGSSDGVEVVEAKFKRVERRNLGSARGHVERSGHKKSGAIGFHLMADAWPYIAEYGYSRQKSQIVYVSANGQVNPEPLLISTTTGKLEFPQLQPGPYTLSIWGTRGVWPRQICFAIEPGQRVTLPQITLYETPPVKIESLHGFRGITARRSLLDATIEQYEKDFFTEVKPGETSIEAKSWGRGTSSWGFLNGLNRTGLLFPTEASSNLGNLGWRVIPYGGNSLAFMPYINPGFLGWMNIGISEPPLGWSVLRLGNAEISEYRSIEIKYGDSKKPGFPEASLGQNAPFQLARGYTYLIQNFRAGYAILLKVH